MYIILSKTTTKTAVIKDQKEIARYTNIPVRTIRKLLKQSDRVEIEDYIIIVPDYEQIKSNSGGKRSPKNEW